MRATAMSSSQVTVAARIDRLPPSAYLQRLVIRLSLGGLFEFYDLFMQGYIGVGFIGAHLFTATTTGLFDWQGFASFVGAGFAGMFVGTLAFSWISDHFGRRPAFLWSLLWYSCATFGMAFANSPVTLDAWRFLAGIGVGVSLITIDTYVTEITPSVSRGRYIQLTQAVTYCAVPAVAIVAWLAIPHVIFGLAGWRYVAFVGSFGAIFVWFIIRGIPESPRWLEAHARLDEAERTVAEMERNVEAEPGRPLPPTQRLAEEEIIGGSAWSEIFSREYAPRTIMLAVFNFFQTIGFYGFASWVPVLLLSEGLTTTRSLAYVMIIAFVNPLGPVFGMRFADRFERKWQIVVLAAVIAASGLAWAAQRSAAGIIIIGVIITIANNWFSGAFHAYQAELYPTRIRTKAVGFVYSWSRFSSIFVGFLIAAMLHAYGVIGVFGVIAAAMSAVAIIIGVFGPKTNRVRLEVLSR